LPKLFAVVAVHTIYFTVYRTRIITSLFVIIVRIDGEDFSKKNINPMFFLNGDAVRFLSCRNSIFN